MEIALEVDIDYHPPMEAWLVARQLVDCTGRWPVLTPKPDPALFSRVLYSPSGDQSPQAIVPRAERLSWPLDRDPRPPEPFSREQWRLWVAHEVQRTNRRCGSSPAVDSILERFPRPEWRALDGHLLEWEEQRCPTTGPEPPSEQIVQFTVAEAIDALAGAGASGRTDAEWLTISRDQWPRLRRFDHRVDMGTDVSQPTLCRTRGCAHRRCCQGARR